MLTTIKGEINNNTIEVGDFNTRLTTMDRSSKEKINKKTQTLNDTLDEMDLTDSYRTFHLKTVEYTFPPTRCTWNILQNRLYLGSQIKSC